MLHDRQAPSRLPHIIEIRTRHSDNEVRLSMIAWNSLLLRNRRAFVVSAVTLFSGFGLRW